MKVLATKKILIGIVIIVMLLLVGHYVAFRFIGNAGAEVATLQSHVASLQAQVTETAKYNPEELKKLYEGVTSKIIPRGDFVPFIESIERTARGQGIAITTRGVTTEPRSDDASDDKQILHVQIETKGSWSQTLKFVNYLEHLPYKVSIKQLGLSILVEDGVKNGTVVWQGKIEVTALKFK